MKFEASPDREVLLAKLNKKIDFRGTNYDALNFLIYSPSDYASAVSKQRVCLFDANSIVV